MKKIKLLRPFTSAGGIFFPIGLPNEGTCEFSTKKCREHCYAMNYSHFDFETDMSQNEMWEIYNCFMGCGVGEIIDMFLRDLDGLQTPILHWFGTGDCQTKDINRISNIIEKVPMNTIQMGFTRNVKLWNRFPEIFALTVEDIKLTEGKHGMFSIPNYIEGTTQMYSPDYIVKGGYCGPYFCIDLIDSSVSHFINCQVCHKLKVGCFDRR